jgi:hypothetical protein
MQTDDSFDFFEELMKAKAKAEAAWVKPQPSKVKLTL